MIAATGTALPFTWVTPSPTALLMLAATGIIGGTSHLGITQALRMAPVSAVALFEYSFLVWGVLFGCLVFDHAPSTAVIGGGSVIVAAGLFNLYRESRVYTAGPITPRLRRNP